MKAPMGGVHKPSAGIEGYILRKLLRDVNDSEGVPFDAFFQRAWHGTSHNFDAFTLQAICPGEGVHPPQWFGKQYQKNLRYLNSEKKRRWNATSGANSLWGKTSNAFEKEYSLS